MKNPHLHQLFTVKIYKNFWSKKTKEITLQFTKGQHISGNVESPEAGQYEVFSVKIIRLHYFKIYYIFGVSCTVAKGSVKFLLFCES